MREKTYDSNKNNSNRPIMFYNLTRLILCVVRERSQAVLSVNPTDICSWRAGWPVYSSFAFQATALTGAWRIYNRWLWVKGFLALLLLGPVSMEESLFFSYSHFLIYIKKKEYKYICLSIV